MKTLILNKLSVRARQSALARPQSTDNQQRQQQVAALVADIKKRGDTAVRDYTLAFDKQAPRRFRVPAAALKRAVASLPPDLRTAMQRAKTNIEKFHKTQRPKDSRVTTETGVTCQLRWLPIERIGLYIPAGSAPLFSALLMQAIPARLAGCKNIILCSPPQRDGNVHPTVLAAAALCGITDVFAVGGAQAIAAMAYGTRTIPKVDKIFGPGNSYVTIAKQIVAQDPQGAAIDLPAGPSEVMVVADPSARADWVAADLLAQAEHDPSAQAMLITTSSNFAKAVQSETTRQLATLPRRAIAAQSLKNSRCIVVGTIATALNIANDYAPEHLILHTITAAKDALKIRNAGSVFLGQWTPETAGDYASGTNHVLPTFGYARAYSGLSLISFMKSMTVQSLSRTGLKRLGPSLITLAEAEALTAHANAVKIRLETRP